MHKDFDHCGQRKSSGRDPNAAVLLEITEGSDKSTSVKMYVAHNNVTKVIVRETYKH